MSAIDAKRWFYFIHEPQNKQIFDELQEIPPGEERVKFANDRGYKFSLDEFQEEASKIISELTAELSDEQLEAITGGTGADAAAPVIPIGMCYASPATYQMFNG